MKIKRFRDWKIRTKLVSITLVMVMTPLMAAAILSLSKFEHSLEEAAEADLEHIVGGLVDLCRAQEEILMGKIDKDQQIAQSVLASFGDDLQLDPDTIVPIEIRTAAGRPGPTRRVPALRIGGRVANQDTEIVDRIAELIGGDATLFQRIDGAGYVRIATTLRPAKSERALGTVLESEIGATLDVGGRYRGPHDPEGVWYITAYDPLVDYAGRVIGALGIGVRGAQSPTLKRAIAHTKIGLTGYPYVIDSTGTLIFHPESPGVNILDSRDTDGDHFIRRMIDDAVLLKPGETGTIRYPWRNPERGETRPRVKIVKYEYFADWDWIVAAGSYEEEIFGASEKTKTYIVLVASLAVVLVLVLSMLLSSIFTRPIQALTAAARRMSEGTLDQEVPVTSEDEIGELGRSFNTMASQIRSQTVDLERTVYKRTRELAASREKYRSTSHMLANILQASTEYAIVATDTDGRILEYNTGAENIYGWTAREMTGRERLSMTFPPQLGRSETTTEFLRGIVGTKGVGEIQTRRVRKSGEKFTAHSIVTLIKNPQGDEVGFLEISRDITEELKVQRELQETRDQLRSIVESSVDVIITADPEGKITFLNPAVRTVLGYEPGELIGGHISKLYQRGIDEAWDLMEKLACHGLVRNHEMKMFTKDGRVLPIMTSAGMLLDPAGRVVGTVGIFTDISRRKELEADLAKAQQTLVQAVKLKAIGDLVAGVAHEINNPLMAASAILHVLLEKADAYDEPLKKRLELLRQVNERIGGIVNHLRDFSRQSETQLRPVSINEAAENALFITRQQLLNHQIEVETTLAESLPMVQGDRNQLEQVFLNLIANARDAMDEKGGVKHLAVRTFLDESDAWPQVVFEIDDTGGGIPAGVAEKIFDPFFSTKEVGKGTGLGLSICYGIIEAHGGKMTLDSREGDGTTFRVSIPAVSPDAIEPAE